MNKPMEREHLALADRHIAVGERLISEQEARIEKLAAAGHDTTDSAELLALLHTTLGHFREHRELILDALRRP